MYSLDEYSITSVLDDMFESLGYARDVLALLGLAYATKVAFTFTIRSWSIFRTYILPRFWYSKDFSGKYGGKWAIITGASEGIGRSYAFKLAERKMNVFIISRNIDKLQNVAKEIESKYNVQTKCFAMDFCKLSDKECYESLKHEIQSLDIGILVNNVGVMYDRLQYFLTVPKETQQQIIEVNVTATVLMTYMILPYMVAKRKGAIINVASLSSVHPTPLMTTYSAAKGFVDTFTKALEYEYSSEGITMQAVQPCYVSTKMTHRAKSNLLVCHSDDYAESALRTLGITRRCYGYWSHGIFALFGEIMPERLYMFCAIYVNPIIWSWLTGIPISSKKTK